MDTSSSPIRPSLLAQILDQTADHLEADPLFKPTHLEQVRAMARSGTLAKPETLRELLRREVADEAH